MSMQQADEPMSHERLAEAGVWIARLHGSKRTRTLEAGFRRWLAESPMNARAFELATQVWEEAGSLRRIVPIPPQRERTSWPRRAFTLAGAVSLALVLAVTLWLYLARGDVATGIGEQRMLTLEDGTAVYLNTATRMTVRYDKNIRRVDFDSGEALFSVARDPARPFVVSVGEREVRAIGTSFVVRRDERRVAVSLVEGKVSISRAAAAAPEVVRADASALKSVITLSSGQRVTIMRGSVPVIDTPPSDSVTAWRRGQVMLNDTRLAEAVDEMNRYSAVRIVVADAAARDILVNGLFQAGDSLSFAHAIGSVYGLGVVVRDNEITLTGR